MSRDQILSNLYSPDRELRRRAAGNFTRGLQGLKRPSTYIFNTVLADKASDDRLRRYPTWITSRNMSNEVDDATVQALVDAVTSRYDIVARYYRLKARLLGLDELFDYDRYAPLPAADRQYEWVEAKQIVLDAYGALSPEDGRGGRLVLRPPLDRRAPAAGQVRRRVQPRHGAVGSPVHPAELRREAPRRDDAGARAGPWRAPEAVGRTGRAPGAHTADNSRDRVGVRRDARLPVAHGAGIQPAGAAGHVDAEDRGFVRHRLPADQHEPLRER